MDIKVEVGDRVTYENEVVEVLNSEDKVKRAIGCDLKIIKIERPKWEVVEERKDLLTEKEREFLKAYLKFMKLENEDMRFKRKFNDIYCLYDDGSGYQIEVDYDCFTKMEFEKEYTLSELGLEE